MSYDSLICTAGAPRQGVAIASSATGTYTRLSGQEPDQIGKNGMRSPDMVMSEALNVVRGFIKTRRSIQKLDEFVIAVCVTVIGDRRGFERTLHHAHPLTSMAMSHEWLTAQSMGSIKDKWVRFHYDVTTAQCRPARFVVRPGMPLQQLVTGAHHTGSNHQEFHPTRPSNQRRYVRKLLRLSGYQACLCVPVRFQARCHACQ